MWPAQSAVRGEGRNVLFQMLFVLIINWGEMRRGEGRRGWLCLLSLSGCLRSTRDLVCCERVRDSPAPGSGSSSGSDRVLLIPPSQAVKQRSCESCLYRHCVQKKKTSLNTFCMSSASPITTRIHTSLDLLMMKNIVLLINLIRIHLNPITLNSKQI